MDFKNFILTKLEKLFKKNQKLKERQETTSWSKDQIAVLLVEKQYKDMTRREKRQYKRLLIKADMWDSQVVIENQVRNNSLNYMP